MSSSQPHWIAAYVARGMAIARRGAITADAIEQIEYAIIDHARTVLPARAAYRWERLIGEDAGHTRVEERNAAVPRWAWSLTDDMAPEWASGTFHLAGDRNGELIYVKLVGVEFSAAEFDQLWPVLGETKLPRSMLASDPAETVIEPVRRPKNAKVEDWHLFWLKAMEMLDAGELEKGAFPSQEALRQALLTRIDDRLSVDSIKPQVSRIWHTFIERGG